MGHYAQLCHNGTISIMGRKAKQYNWDAAKDLYTQGVRYRAIAEQLNIPLPTLKAHIRINGWIDSKLVAIQERRPKAEPEPETREAVSRRMKRWFVADADKVMKALESHDPSGLELKELEQRESVVKSLYSRVSGQFGWENENEGSNPIRGNLLAQLAAEINQQREIVLDRQAKSKVIDIQPVTTAEQPMGQADAKDNSCCASTGSVDPAEEKHAFSGEEPAGG